MTTKVKQEIIGVFNRDISQILSINQIASILNKAYPNINSSVNDFIDENILNKYVAGRSYLCSINLDSKKAVALLSLNEAEEIENLSKKFSKKFFKKLKEIQKEFKIYTIIYSNKKFYFVLDHIHDQSAIKNYFKNLKKNLVFFTKEEFQNKIIQDKKLFTKKTVIYSSEKYYELLNEVRGNLIQESLKNE